MWTKNGKKLFIKQLSANYTDNGGSKFLFRGCTDIDIEISANTVVSGVANNISYLVYDMTANIDNSSTKGLFWHLYIGTGTTPPTEDDIILEAPVTFTCPVVPQISRGDNYTTLLITYTFTNNTDTTQTITEIGLCSRLKVGNPSPAVLLNRRLLENPVTMEAGESKVFTFTIDTSNLQE